MANEEHLNILKQDVDVWNQWRTEMAKENRHSQPVAATISLRHVSAINAIKALGASRGLGSG